MRKRFSERYGFVKVRDTFQIDSMDDRLRNRLWNQFRTYYIDTIEYSGEYFAKEYQYNFFIKLYDSFFKISEKPNYHIFSLENDIQKFFEKLKWYEIYDFIEYVPKIYYSDENIPSFLESEEIKRINIEFIKSVNQVLEEEMSGYRFIDNYIAPIIDEVEIKEVEEALDCKYTPVRQHLSNALELLSDRENPNYQNSIKESITAVESVAKIITGKETDLAKCLKVMDIDLNGQFKTSMIQLYGWTCKEDGIRHGHTKEELKTSFEEAKYMLVSCSAFVNYLISKNEQSLDK